MNAQPFDPMDKLLREALESDALPPSDLTDRIMAQVERTPQGQAPAAPRKTHYKRWLASAVACLVIVGAALPLALRSRADKMAEAADHAALDDAAEDYAADSGDALVSGAVPNEQAQKQVDSTVHDQPYDPMDSALDHAAELLEQQGCVLEVLARSDTAVQVAIADPESHPSGNADLLYNAMVASGFTLEEDWYVLEQEDTTP